MADSSIGLDFDTVIERRGTDSSKWNGLKRVFGSDEVLPLWVADMDFASPRAVTEALLARAAHPVYAYNIQQDSLYQAVIRWVKVRHNWDIEKDWILLAPGVVPSIILSLLALSDPGDGIVIQPPVYPPFFASVRDNDRTLVENPLIDHNGHYQMDFADLEQKLAQPRNKILLLCNPHNPVGRVWSREELKKVYDLCQRYNVDVLSDEIHSDLVYEGHRHTVFASLGTPVCQQSVTFLAASKTFNVAGLNFSFIIVPCSQRRRRLTTWFQKLHISRGKLFGAPAAEAAYREGEGWLNALLVYLEKNADTLVEFVNTRLPGVRAVKPEGTYLAWLDFRDYYPNGAELEKFLVDKAKVGLNAGIKFGRQGNGFARLNFATQRNVLLEGLARIENALRAEGKL